MNIAGTHLWMLLLLGKSVLVCLAFLGIGIAFRHSSAATLRMLWRGAVVSLFGVIVVSFSPAVWRLPLPVGGAAQGLLATRTDLSLPGAPAGDAELRDQAGVARNAGISYTDVSAVHLLLWLWAGGAVLMLCRYALAALKVHRLTNRAKAFTGSTDFTYRNAEVFGPIPPGSVTLLVSDEVRSPFVTGLARNVIVLPKNSETWSAEEGRIIMRHELAHVANRDIAWQSIASMMLALLWINPFAWLIHSRLLKAQEAVADDTVLDGGVDEIDYAATLSKVATRLRGLPAGCPAAPMARQSTLGWRVARILNRSQQRGPAGAFAFTAVVALTVTVAVTLGFAGFQATAADGDKNESVADAKQAANQPLWTRKYRDTFQLKPSFAERFPGTPAEAVAAIRKELAATEGSAVDDLYLEVDKDKRTLTVEFPEKRARKVEQALWRILQRYSSWDELLKERQQAVDRALQPFREEAEKQRKLVARNAVEAAKLREAAKIIDPDFESPSASVSAHGSASPESKAATSRYLEAKARYLQSKKILEALELRYSTKRMEIGIDGPRGPRE